MKSLQILCFIYRHFHGTLKVFWASLKHAKIKDICEQLAKNKLMEAINKKHYKKPTKLLNVQMVSSLLNFF